HLIVLPRVSAVSMIAYLHRQQFTSSIVVGFGVIGTSGAQRRCAAVPHMHYGALPARHSVSSSMERPTGAAPRQSRCNVRTPTVPSECFIRTNGPLKIPDLFWRTT